MTLYDELGGEAPLRAILSDFYDRVFADVMIGYLFAKQSKPRLIDLEFQFSARNLGAPIEYTGRPMRQAHAAHRISKGHFDRRNKLLELTLRDHAVPSSVFDAWMRHVQALAPAVVGAPDICGPVTVSASE